MVFTYKTVSQNPICVKSFEAYAQRQQKNSWIAILMELVEAYFKSARQSRINRTWHQHVVPHANGWAVRREGNKRITSKHRRQDTAINKAKRLARKYKADVVIHRQDGTIRDRINYD
jgi:hypothetical protein